MPFTPFHMGPGIFIKALLQSSFSVMVFGWSQIVIDLQPLFVLYQGEGHLHGFSHTYLGATLLAIFAAFTGKYLSELGFKILELGSSENPLKVRWSIAFFSAFTGTYTHVLLDSVMHRDVEPYFPLQRSSDLLGIVNFDQLHQFCLFSGLVGAFLFHLIQWRSQSGSDQDIK